MSDGRLEVLGGQGMFSVFGQASRNINSGNLTQYDGAIDIILRNQASEYASGGCTRSEAISKFKQEVKNQQSIN